MVLLNIGCLTMGDQLLPRIVAQRLQQKKALPPIAVRFYLIKAFVHK